MAYKRPLRMSSAALRKTETGLACFTLAMLAVYFPVETWATSPLTLWNPFYVVDLIAMALLLWGAVHSLRARPRPAPGILGAGYAWAAANGWRATFGRVRTVSEGGELAHGAGELWGVGAATALTLMCLALCLYLIARRSTHVRDESEPPHAGGL